MKRSRADVSLPWDDLAPEQQDALDRIWRGAAASADDAAPLVEAGFVVKASAGFRLTDEGECVVLARLPALRHVRRATRMTA